MAGGAQGCGNDAFSSAAALAPVHSPSREGLFPIQGRFSGIRQRSGGAPVPIPCSFHPPAHPDYFLLLEKRPLLAAAWIKPRNSDLEQAQGSVGYGNGVMEKGSPTSAGSWWVWNWQNGWAGQRQPQQERCQRRKPGRASLLRGSSRCSHSCAFPTGKNHVAHPKL